MSKGKNKAIFRSVKLKRGRGKSSLGSSWRHQEHHTLAADITYPEMSNQNHTKKWFVNYEELTKFIKQRIKEHNKIVDKERAELIAKGETKNLPRALRNDASIACECIFTFSPEMAGEFDIKAWTQANLAFIMQEFIAKGAKAIRIDLHMDETTPHIHFIFCPTTKEGKISAKEFLGGAQSLSLMQDRYAKAMEQFGLTRGFSRYNVYKAVQASAIKEGFEPNYKGVKAYCEKHDIPVPDRRRHTKKEEWLASLERNIAELEKNKAQLELDVKEARAKMNTPLVETLNKQLNEAKARLEYLESFVAQDKIRPFWAEYLNTQRKPTRAHTEDEIFDSLW